ncbi:histidine kinase [Nocardioides acrostichi]|uniref:histidine kinase n=1 Tax=Nocardioides acrostichi TaxID=2784339 RepID=A0A930UZY1_9ACTN|nr:hypothetical protein [Nocardioides acrostichi]MBF4162130.1 hypothetical protein [Nocardioides acrostichi]
MAGVLTERQRALDRLAELDRAQSEFVTTVSHERRTPMTSAYHESAGLLRDRSLDVELRLTPRTHVRGDRDQLVRAVVVLSSNAVKFTQTAAGSRWSSSVATTTLRRSRSCP